jgi:uncharacterized cupin superfamily protein
MAEGLGTFRLGGLQMSLMKSALTALAACVAIHSGALAEPALAKLSRAEVQGTAFQRPDVRKVPDGAVTALELDTMSSSDGKFDSGTYKVGPEHYDYVTTGYESYEFIYVITGSIKLTSADGKTHFVRSGEAVTIPKAWKGRWDSDGYTKLWVTYDPDAKR